MTTVGALQEALAAEHAAVHLLAVVAAQTSTTERPEQRALAAGRRDVHLQRRNSLEQELRAREAEPVPAAPAYELPDLRTEDAVRGAGLQVEERCLPVYAALVAASSGPLRAWTVDALVDSSLACLDWGGAPRSFPGADEL